MAEIYIRTDPTTKVVTFVHRRPFDPINGLGATREELLKTGFFVDEFPSPISSPGLRAIAYYDHETNKVRFEYQALPFSEKTRLDMLEDIITGIVKCFPNIYDIVKQTQEAMVMSLDDENNEKQSEIINRGESIMSGFPQFLAYQIHMGKMSKDETFELYPNLVEEIQSYLDDWDVVPTVQEEDLDSFTI